MADDTRDRLIEVGAQGLVSSDLHGAPWALRDVAAVVVESLLDSGEVVPTPKLIECHVCDRYRGWLEEIADLRPTITGAYAARKFARRALDGEGVDGG